ncbi:caspase family protein [Streptomyces sp. NRRL B-24572]|uniref:caspase family protein n=1 Tax=Streptomyces sp. NRRL B-24572 TaxID=1962156 RepID=UPI001C4F99C0|nr:caspase family protein [Streptomyces sp. NRRL B-24572]
MITTEPAAAAKRALVIASEVHGLSGCRNDAELIGSALRGYGFDVQLLAERQATRAGILGAYEDLIEASRAQDAAVVYYAGHGGRIQGGLRAHDEPEALQFIVPTDIDDTTSDDFRGILSDEMSVLQWRLTLRTRNVTTLLDNCHATRMSRDPLPRGMHVRGWETQWPVAAVRQRWADVASQVRRLRADHPDHCWYDDNPHAVRLVACGASQQAIEDYVAEFGSVHGLFTAAVVTALENGTDLTWHMVGERVRNRVLTRNTAQRPDCEGPTNRLLFSETTRARPAAVPVRVDPATATSWLDGAALHGITVGDEYLLCAAGSPVPAAGRVGVVVDVRGGAALLRMRDHAPVPAGQEAHPLSSRRPAPTVRLRNADLLPHEWLDRYRAALPGLRTEDDPPGDDLAMLTVGTAGVMLHDAAGRSLYERPRPFTEDTAARLGSDVDDLAHAARLRQLGPDSFAAPLEVPVAFDAIAVRAGGADGSVEDAVLHPGDRVRMRVRNLGASEGPGRTVYAHVLDLGVGGRVSVLNTAEPSGIELMPGETRALGRLPGGEDPGLPLSWPAGLPADGPRFETLTAVFADRPQSMANLVRAGVGNVRDFVVPQIDAGQYTLVKVTFLLCPGGPVCEHV